MAKAPNKKPRPAKDLKPTGLRAMALQEGKLKKTKELAKKLRADAAAQAKDKKKRPAKDLKKDDARSKLLKESKAGNIKAKPTASVSSAASKSLVGTAARTAGRFAGPVGALVAMTSQLGDGQETKQSGPQMKGGRQAGYSYRSGGARPETPGAYPKAKKAVGGARPETVSSYPSAKKVTGGVRPETPGSYMPKSVKASVPKAKPKDKAFTLGTGAQTPKAQAPKAQTSVSAKAPTFKGNWVGAAPTEMQKRGGAKIKRPNLLDLLRKKKR